MVQARPRFAPAFVAASLGVAALGLLAFLRQASEAVSIWLTWRTAAEMTGPGAIAVAVWLGSWPILAVVWRSRDVSGRTAILCLVLVAAGALLAIPPLDQLFL